jgi:hypothetical protein
VVGLLNTLHAAPDPAIAKANEKMATPIAADFDKISLKDVLDLVRDQAGVDMLVDWNALNNVGLSVDTQFNLRLKNKLPADAVLSLVARSVGGQIVVETARGGVIVVTAGGPAAAQEGPLVTRTYDVLDLVTGDPGAPANVPGPQPSPDAATSQLIAVITRTVHPDAWAEAGGQSTVSSFRGKLIVKAPEAIHKETIELLDMLRTKPAKAK